MLQLKTKQIIHLYILPNCVTYLTDLLLVFWLLIIVVTAPAYANTQEETSFCEEDFLESEELALPFHLKSRSNILFANSISKDEVSVDLKLWLLLYGYPYEDTMNQTYYYYPGPNSYFRIELIPKGDAPGKRRISRAYFSFIGEKCEKNNRSLHIAFNGITFTSDVFLDKDGIPLVDENGNPLKEREFVYLVRQTQENLNYIDYDIKKQYQTSLEYEVSIRVYKDSDEDLHADIESNEPMFENQYKAASVSIAKDVTGIGGSPIHEFPIKITFEESSLNTDGSLKWSPLENWSFVAAIGFIGLSTEDDRINIIKRKLKEYSTFKTTNDGSIILILKHQDYALFHGIPDSVRYTINELSNGTATYQPIYYFDIGDHPKEHDIAITETVSVGEDIANTIILNKYIGEESDIPKPIDEDTLFLPSELIKIQDHTFEGTLCNCVYCNEGLTEIGYRAFAENSCLTEVFFPKSIQSIDESAFENCPQLNLFYGYSNTVAESFALNHDFRFFPLDNLN